jgi:hypothetical protein
MIKSEFVSTYVITYQSEDIQLEDSFQREQKCENFVKSVQICTVYSWLFIILVRVEKIHYTNCQDLVQVRAVMNLQESGRN